MFDPERVPDPGAATSPPYDVIDDAARERYLEASPHNVVRLLLPDGGEERYQRAGELLREWLRSGDLQIDPADRYYVYEMAYRAPDGTPMAARGVIGALDLVELGTRVQPHEETMPKTRGDRLALLEATAANLDPITVLSPAAGLGRLIAVDGALRLDFSADGVRHRLWDVDDPERVEQISATVASEPVVIADGHHRYVTARTHQAAQGGPGPWDAIMAFVAPARSSGLLVGAAHRVFTNVADPLADVSPAFDAVPANGSLPERAGDLVLVPGPGHRRPSVRLRARPETLDRLPRSFREASAAVAREILYPLLGVTEAEAVYDPDPAHALARLEDHPHGAVVLTAPVSEQSIALAIDERVVFPQKTTYFVPKPRAGLVIRSWR